MPRSAMRLTITTLLLAGLLALVVFWLLMRAQRGSENVVTTPGIDPTTGAVIVAVPTVSPYRTEQVLVDGQMIQLDTLNSKDTLTEAQWAAQNQPVAPPAAVIQATSVPTLPLPTTDPNQLLLPTATSIVILPTATFPVPQVTAQAVGVPANVEKVIFKDYQVVQGDSLYSIAEAQNSSIELMAKHGIDANDLVPGAVIRLPYANPAYCPGYRAYVVRDRDTVFRIANFFNTTVAFLAQLNHLDANYTIYTTDVICVP